jgi:serine protease Do
VAHVRSGSSAEKAGIRSGDKIVAFDGIRIHDPDILAEIIQQQAVGSTHRLKIERDGSSRTVEVVTELAVKSPPSSQEPAWDAGEPTEIVYSRELQLEASAYRPFEDSSNDGTNREGVVIVSVHLAGPAYQAGVREGMRLLSVDGHDVHDLDSFVEVMEQASLAQGIELAVQTDNGTRRLSVTRQ